MSKEVDMTGKVFGRLKVIEKAGRKIYGGRDMPAWRCKCECGNEVFVCRQELRDKKSCGCLKIDVLRERSTKHGECIGKQSRLYKVYQNMLRRCSDPNSTEYQNYGGRGISVCDEWANNPESFFEWSKSNGYNETLTLDRIDVDKNYSPNNCRFVTMKVQANNTTRNHRITYNGETLTMSEWADKTGIPYSTLRSRINCLGWDIEKALTHPVHFKKVS